MSLVITRERFCAKLCEEITPLLKAQWEEIANYREAIPLDVDFDAYRRFDEQGKLLMLMARERGLLIGYAIFFLLNTVHYKGSLFALNDVIYLRPEHRKGSAGLRLIREAELSCMEAGVVKISWHVKPTNDMQKLLELRGYKVEEINLGKLL